MINFPQAKSIPDQFVSWAAGIAGIESSHRFSQEYFAFVFGMRFAFNAPGINIINALLLIFFRGFGNHFYARMSADKVIA
jgi:hypothetical protein